MRRQLEGIQRGERLREGDSDGYDDSGNFDKPQDTPESGSQLLKKTLLDFKNTK